VVSVNRFVVLSCTAYSSVRVRVRVRVHAVLHSTWYIPVELYCYKCTSTLYVEKRISPSVQSSPRGDFGLVDWTGMSLETSPEPYLLGPLNLQGHK
jgi:hypothetical protein